VFGVPFDSSCVDFDRHKYADSRDYLVGLARIIVKEPLSTHIVRTRTLSGKTRYLVIDRAQAPAEGDIAVICADSGLKAGRLRRVTSREDIWGKVVWVIEEG
jgi:hypothetical protein